MLKTQICVTRPQCVKRNNVGNTDLLCPQVCIAGLLLAEKGAVHRVVLLQLHCLHLLLYGIHGDGAAWSCLKSATRKDKTMFRCRLSYEQGRKLVNETRINYCSVTVRQLSEVFSNIPMQIHCYGIIPLGKDLKFKS